MKKLAVSSLVSLFILSCAVSAPNNSTQDTSSPLNRRMQYAPTGLRDTSSPSPFTLHPSPVKEDFSALATKYNFAELKKEYKSFSTKALSDSYVKRMFTKFIIETLNSVQLTRQIEFARYLKQNSDASYETSLRNMFTETPSLYSTLTGIPAIQNKITAEPATFGNFLVSLAPYSTVPVASAATNITSASFTANWSTVTGATSYTLILDGVEITGITATSHPVTNLQPGSNHTYKVKAISSGIPGTESNQISVITILPAPVAGTATGVGQTSITANWSAVTGATSYTLVFNGTPITGITDTSYTKNGLTAGTTYPYYVKAVNAVTESVNSGTISTVTIPGNPTANVASDITSTSFTANWGTVTGATSYKLTLDSVETDIGDVTSKVITGLSPATNHAYSVKAYNGSGTSGASNEINTATLAGTNFVEVQSILTNGVLDWEPFTIGADTYLAAANYFDDSSHNINSKIYKRNGSSFVEVQSILTNGINDLESFTIGTDTYLAAANYFDGSSHNINSKIYKWNTSSFVEIQSIPTSGASDWESFTIGTDTYLAVANIYNGSLYNINSKIYKWNGSSFDEIQSILTNGANNWESFTIGADTYLVVANNYNGTWNLNSTIYKWNGSAFDEIQSILTNGATDWESFTIGTDTYLAVANQYNGSLYNINSKIYKWNTSSFVEIQSIPTNGANDWESFTIGADTYLAIANYHDVSSHNINSKIYKWNGSSFNEIQSIPTNGALDWESFTIGANTYLAVANYLNGSSRNIESRIYKWE